MGDRVWLHQVIDGEDRYIQWPASGVPQQVQSGWLPCDPPPVKQVELVRPTPAAATAEDDADDGPLSPADTPSPDKPGRTRGKAASDHAAPHGTASTAQEN